MNEIWKQNFTASFKRDLDILEGSLKGEYFPFPLIFIPFSLNSLKIIKVMLTNETQIIYFMLYAIISGNHRPSILPYLKLFPAEEYVQLLLQVMSINGKFS